MLAHRIIVVIFTTMVLICPTDAFLSWLFRGNGDDNGDRSEEVEKSVPMPRGDVPFEMTTTDEKFLSEAKEHMTKDLTPLDTCHHLVIDELRGTCSQLSEEGLGKLAVQLLNCQSSAEGRVTFPCSRDMSIAECTSEMDPTTWNAYQIVSNRARAICYATRQQQFRMKAEYTVNKLVHTTENQVHAMYEIKEGQEKISEATVSTLDKIEAGQRDLELRQTSIKNVQMNIHTYIASNLRDLTKEKALISTGNKELAEMTDNIRQKLDNATKKLDQQEDNQRSNHKELLNDLAVIRSKAREVWKKIDNSSQHMLQYHDDTTRHYQETLDNLQRVNKTVGDMLETIAKLEATMEQKLTWISSFMGGTGEHLALLSNVVLHTLFFLVAAVSATFLRTPMFSRIVLLLIVPLNAWAEGKHHRSLGFTAMSLFILLTVILNWLVGWSYRWYQYRKYRSSTASSSYSSTSSFLSPFALPGPCTSPEMPTFGGSLGQAQGLATPDLRKLVVMLESLVSQGVLSPGVRPPICGGDGVPSPMASPTSVGETSFSSDSLSGEDEEDVATPLIPGTVDATTYDTPDDPLPAMGAVRRDGENRLNRSLTDSAKARVEYVRRRLLNSPVGMSPLSRPRLSESRSTTPPPSTSSRSSRASTPSRPTCTGLTRTGQPCRNACSENSDFCYRHQPENTMYDAK